jgi:hypothetical protein
MSEEIENALRRELRAESVPFEESRAEDMIRAVTESRPAGSPRAWLAPLAAAAAVVVVGGGIALATSGGNGNSTAGPAQAGGPGPSTSSGGNGYGVAECGSIGSPEGSLGEVFPASAVSGSVYPTVAPTDTGVNQASSVPDLPPPPPTVSPTASLGRRSLPAPPPSMAATASEVPLPAGSSAPIEILTPSDVIVICSTGTATPSRGEVQGELCTKSDHEVTCVGSGDCTTPDAVSSGPYNDVLCVDEGSASYAPLSPTGSADIDPIYSATATSVPGGTAGTVTFTVQTNVRPGQPGGNAYVPDIPHGYRLEITGLTLHNPAGDEGTITIGDGSTNILRENLADFRTHDYDVGDQLTSFMPGTSVVVGVNCANTNDNCTPAVDVTGRLEPAR